MKRILAPVFAALLFAMIFFAAADASGQSQATCKYRLLPGNMLVNSKLEYYSIKILAAPHCAWTVQSNRSWITFPSPPSGQGNGMFKIEVAANTGGAERIAHLYVGSQGMTIRQKGIHCTYSFDPTQVTVAPAPCSVNVAIHTSAGCPWTARSSAPQWLTPAYATGQGPATIQYHLGRYAGTADRTGKITVEGKTLTVRQEGCRYTVPTDIQAGSGQSTLSFTVATQPSCPWQASSTAGWIVITKGNNTLGSQVVFGVRPNTANQPRTATIRVSGKNVRVRQNGNLPATVQ